MLSINTNISSLIAQHSMSSATAKLNQAIERMTTGFKINHASDNAANYSISTNMTTKINSYMVAEDNAAMGLDMTTAISENLDLINQHASRIRDLCEQASNGTYGEESLKAIQAEIESRMTEIERIKANAEFNGIKLFKSEQAAPVTFGARQASGGVTGSFIQEVDQLTEEEAIAQGYTIIKTADELQAMQDNLSGKYILMNDIDLDGYDWTPVGTNWDNTFQGELNGNGFVIKNLTINKPTEDNVGLFGHATSATIKNLGIEDADVVGQYSVGILLGYSTGCLDNVYCTGEVQGSYYIGGVIGGSNGTTLNNGYSDCVVTGNSYVGGLAGGYDMIDGITSTNSYSTGSVSGNDCVGGLIGFNRSQMINCYSDCIVTGTTCVGGLVGKFDSFTGDTITDCYWDTEKSGTTVAVASGSFSGTCTGITTVELQELINNGTLVKAKPPTPPAVNSGNGLSTIFLQIGIHGDLNSQIQLDLGVGFNPLNILVTDSETARNNLTVIDDYLAKISAKQTELGAVQNRLESVLEEVVIQRDNLISSRSTIRDADIADESSRYIQQQILQQASATLLATANQSPSIALQLI